MKREKEVVDAFISSVKSGAMTEDEAVQLMEDQSRYPGLTEAAKDAFYAEFADPLEPIVEVLNPSEEVK